MLPVINKTTTEDGLRTLREGSNVIVSIGGVTGKYTVKKVGRIPLKGDVTNPLTVHRHGDHQPYKPFQGGYHPVWNEGLKDKNEISGIDGVVLEDASGNTVVVGPGKRGTVTTYDSAPFDY
jgi:hypothetical protein